MQKNKRIRNNICRDNRAGVETTILDGNQYFIFLLADHQDHQDDQPSLLTCHQCFYRLLRPQQENQHLQKSSPNNQ